MKWALPWRRKVRTDTMASRWQASSVVPDSRWESSLQGDSRWHSTMLAPEGPWPGSPGAEDERWRRQVRTSRRWAMAGITMGVLAGALLFAPATWLAGWVGRLTDGRLLLAEARGTVWNGSAVPVLTGGAGSRDAATPPGRLYWTLRPAWTGLTLQAQQPCCLVQPLQLALTPGIGQYTLRIGPAGGSAPGAPGGSAGVAPGATPVELGAWPTAWLAGLGTPWNTVQLRGALHLNTAGLTLHSSAGRMRIDGTLALELRDLSSRLSPLPVLGSYRLELQGQGDAGPGSRLSLLTLSGPLRVEGSGLWSGASLRFRGQAQAAEGQEAALANLLNIFGRRQGALSVISIG